ncbi:hypothetical protein B0H13DRAFT_2024885 [Mycena leptocephala]|nr:hypothetical protein B0H13DRAFT_2024885 [Mycena leptocephala]
MAAPFIYVPEDPSSARSPAYHNPYYATPQSGQTPFLPPSPLLYPDSPHLRASGGATSEAEAPNPNGVLWPTNSTQYESAYTASWIPLSARPRTTSWHASGPPTASPFLQPKAPAFLHTQSYSTPGHKRAKSWGNADAPPPSSWIPNSYQNTPAPQTPLQIHPWLNGDAPSPAFFFDLAPAAFVPQRAVSMNPPQGQMLTAAEVREPAFHPPLTGLRILHPKLPFWPIDLALPADGQAQALPISLGDVLAAMHHALHVRIAQADWATLSAEDQQRVTLAFAQRCRAEAVRSQVPPAKLRDREVEERNLGVKRVDFLLGKTVFKGLVRSPGDGEGCVRMVTA